MKLFKQYPDAKKGMEKFSILVDYLTMSQDFGEKMGKNPLEEITLNNLLMWSNHWHKTGESRGKKEDFVNYQIDMVIKDYHFEQIKDSHQLHEEGKIQKHCVYTYTNQCMKREAIIISMKNANGKRVSTLRLSLSENKITKFSFFKNKKSKWKLVENRKKMNKACSKEEKELANLYFKQIQPILERYALSN